MLATTNTYLLDKQEAPGTLLNIEAGCYNSRLPSVEILDSNVHSCNHVLASPRSRIGLFRHPLAYPRINQVYKQTLPCINMLVLLHAGS